MSSAKSSAIARDAAGINSRCSVCEAMIPYHMIEDHFAKNHPGQEVVMDIGQV